MTRTPSDSRFRSDTAPAGVRPPPLPVSLATCEDLWADECAVRSDYTRLNHSGEANRGPPLQEEVMQQLPEAVRPRFAEYE